MIHEPAPSTPARAPSAHRFHGRKVWDWARADYEDGQPASVICKMYGIGLSTFRERAAREGWRRSDAEPDLRPADLDRLDGLGDTDVDPQALALMAWKRFALAVRDGDRLGASAWLRLHRQLRSEMRAILADVELDETFAAMNHPASEDAEPESPFPAVGRDGEARRSPGGVAQAFKPSLVEISTETVTPPPATPPVRPSGPATLPVRGGRGRGDDQASDCLDQPDDLDDLDGVFPWSPSSAPCSPPRPRRRGRACGPSTPFPPSG